MRRHPTLAGAAVFAALAVAAAWSAAVYLGWGWPAGFSGATILAGIALLAGGAALSGAEMSDPARRGPWTGSAPSRLLWAGKADGFGFERAARTLVLASPLVLAVGFALLGLSAVS